MKPLTRTLCAGVAMTLLLSGCDDSRKRASEARKAAPEARPGAAAPPSRDLVPADTSEQAAGALKNTGFEEGLAHWNAFGATVVTDGLAPHGGERALKLHRDFGIAGPHVVGVYQDVPARSGERTLFALYLRDGNGAGDRLDATGSLSIDLRWFNEAGEELRAPIAGRAESYLGGSATDDAWHLRAAYLEAPEGAVRAQATIVFGYRPGAGSQGKGSVWVDDVILEPAPESLLRNGSFEDGLAGWDTFGVGAAVETYAPLFEKAALKLVRDFDEEAGEHVNGVAQVVPVEAGGRYLLTGRARSGTGGGDALEAGLEDRVRLEWLADDSELLGVVELAGVAEPAGGRFAKRLQAPAGATRVKVAVLVHHDGEGPGGGSAWFDQLALAPLD